MSASDQIYSEAWCTNLLSDQQAVNERMGKVLRGLKDSPNKEDEHTELWCKELLRDVQAVNEKMTKLLRDQQRTINELHRKLEGNPKKQLSTTEKYHNEHLLGSKSAAIIWTGTITDLVPVSVDGKEYKALIMTPRFVETLNDLFASDIAMKLMNPEVYTESEYLAYLKTVAASDSEPGFDCGLLDNMPGAEFTNKELSVKYFESFDRMKALQLLVGEERKIYHGALSYVKGYTRRAFEKNHIERKDTFKEQTHYVLLTRTEVRKGPRDDGTNMQEIEAKIAHYDLDEDSEFFGRLKK